MRAYVAALVLLGGPPVAAQVAADSSAVPQDSVEARAPAVRVAPRVAAPPVAPARAARPDSLRRPSPGRALRRSLLLPGWGQVYVGQPGRAPFAAGAVVGLGTAAVLVNGRYVRLRHAYLYVSRETADPTVPDAGNEFAEYFETWQAAGALPAATVRARRDGARRTRDLVVLGTTVTYLLQALDAYVAAHLVGFDVSEDLSLRVSPAVGPAGAGVPAALGPLTMGPGATLTLRF